MFQLILVVIAIALMSALVLAAVNYTPWWVKTSQDTEVLARTGVQTLESAYDVVVRSADGTAPTPTEAADGGLASHFLGAMKFTPPTPPGFVWVYGRHAADGSRYAGMDYFCLAPVADAAMSEGVWRGLARARAQSSPEQFFLGAACGEASNVPAPSTYPVSARLTYFVAYTPGVTR